MKTLTQDAYRYARRYIEEQGRPLERALAEYRFSGAWESAVLHELVRFQNPDGGFGHGLEPDVRTPSSSALATALGLKVLRDLGCNAEDSMVRGAVEYLLSTMDEAGCSWRPVPLDVNDAPHAPWWHDEDGSLARTFDGYRIIPRVLIAALLVHYEDLAPLNRLREIVRGAVDAIDSVPVLGEGGGSDLEYAIQLAEADGLPQDDRTRVADRVLDAIPNAVVRDAEKWSTYCITPLRIAPRPTTLGAESIREELEAHLDYLIDTQNADGSWHPTWTWGGAYPDAWEQAQRDWSGILTLDALESLEAFGRLDGQGLERE